MNTSNRCHWRLPQTLWNERMASVSDCSWGKKPRRAKPERGLLRERCSTCHRSGWGYILMPFSGLWHSSPVGQKANPSFLFASWQLWFSQDEQPWGGSHPDVLSLAGDAGKCLLFTPVDITLQRCHLHLPLEDTCIMSPKKDGTSMQLMNHSFCVEKQSHGCSHWY